MSTLIYPNPVKIKNINLDLFSLLYTFLSQLTKHETTFSEIFTCVH